MRNQSVDERNWQFTTLHTAFFLCLLIAIVMVAQKGKIGWRRFHNCARMHFSFKDFRRMTVHTGHWCWWCTRMHYLHQWSDPPFFVIISSSVLTCENRTIWGDLTQFLSPIQLQLNKYLSELCSDATIVCNICGINLFGNIQLDKRYISFMSTLQESAIFTPTFCLHTFSVQFYEIYLNSIEFLFFPKDQSYWKILWLSSNILLAKVNPWVRLEALVAIPGKDYTLRGRNGISQTSCHWDIEIFIRSCSCCGSQEDNIIYCTETQ